MKHKYLLLIAFLFALSFTKAQCVIDTANVSNGQGIYPSDDSLPCIINGTPYDQTLQIKLIASYDTTYFTFPIHIVVHWVHILHIDGLPTGINWDMNPVGDTLLGGGYGCLHLYGTTTTTTGAYDIHPISDIFATLPSYPPFFAGGDTVLRNTDLSKIAFPYTLYVVNSSDSCRLNLSAGINDISNSLVTSFLVYPNPNSGIFDVKLNSAARLAGEIEVMNIAGQQIFTQPVDISGSYHTTIDLKNFSKGLYLLQLRTANGIVSRNISIE